MTYFVNNKQFEGIGKIDFFDLAERAGIVPDSITFDGLPLLPWESVELQNGMRFEVKA